MKKRKLAAIMFTDIEGYTATMQRSEEEALTLRDKHRKVFQHTTEKFDGEILQYYGDGTLSVFDSVVDAVNCGIEMQRSFSQEPKVPVRIGIHLGDIIRTDDEIIGDGVNIASRIESLSVVGSVLISDRVYYEVRNTAGIETKFLKKFKLKNVQDLVGVYAISNAGLVVPKVEEITGKIEEKKNILRTARKLMVPSLVAIVVIAILGFWGGSKWNEYLKSRPNIKMAVLPIENLETTDNDFQLGDLTEELIEELSKLDRLTVLSRKTSDVLAAGVGPSESLMKSQVETIDYFVDGSIKQEKEQLSINIQLLKKENNQKIWEEEFHGDISEAKNILTDIAIEIGKEIGLQRSSNEMAKRAILKPIDPKSYAYYLQGKSHFNKYTPEGMMKGIEFMEKALDENPADAHAYAHLAEAYVNIGHSPNSGPEVFPKALSAARRAIQLDSTVAMGWAALAHYHTYFGMDWELAEYAFDRANELDPNMAYNHYHRAWYLVLFGRMNEAITEHKIAQELEPFDPLHSAWLGGIYRMVGMYDEALAEVEKAAQMGGDNQLSHLVRGKIYMDIGRTEEALESFKAGRSKYNNYAQALLKLGRMDEVYKLIDELETMEPNSWWALCLSKLYCEMGEKDKCFEWLNFPERHAWFPWIRTAELPDEIINDPRFIKLIEDMNLPQPGPFEFDPEAL